MLIIAVLLFDTESEIAISNYKARLSNSDDGDLPNVPPHVPPPAYHPGLLRGP